MPTEAAILKQMKGELTRQGKTFKQVSGKDFSYDVNGDMLNVAKQVSKLNLRGVT